MKKILITFITVLSLFNTTTVLAYNSSSTTGFNVTVLGARGGIQDGNLSAFMISPYGNNNAITCDAGSIINGLKIADEKGAFTHIKVPKDSENTKVGHILKNHIKGYLISHAHLDHVLGMIIASPDDSAKPIYGLPSTINKIKNTHFNWQSWANFSNSGIAPTLNKYNYIELQPAVKYKLVSTSMSVTAFPLNHTQESTAFLIENNSATILCFGDTIADSITKSNKLLTVWKKTAKLIKSGSLKAIIIESSYTNDKPDNLLFGHLTPKYLLEELHKLEKLAGGQGALAGLPIIISHIKYTLLRGEPTEKVILKELNAGNDMKVNFIIPQQGDYWHFK